ncbi:MAG: MFS transporter [Pseudomonadota bacterium]
MTPKKSLKLGTPLLSNTQLAAYAGPQAILFLTRVASFGIIPALYAEKFDITLDKIAGILILMRFAEAILQLVVGQLTDLTARGKLNRKVWVISGTILAAVGLWFLYSPPANAGLVYLAVWLGVVTLVGSATDVAYLSWGAEITTDYAERGKVATVQQWAAIAGQVIFFGIPLLPLTPTSEITFEALGLIAIIVAVSTPFIIFLAYKLAPIGNPGAESERPTLTSLAKAILANRPMQVLVVGGMFFDIAASVAVGIGFLFIDSYLAAGEYVPYQGLTQMAGAFIGISLAGFFLLRFQKHHVWAASAFIYCGVMLLALFLTPDMAYAGLVYVGITTMAYLVAMGAVVAPNSIIGDVVDYERWRSGAQQSGQFVAAFQLTQKLVGGLAGALGFYLLAQFGFEPGQDSYDSQATTGIKLVAVILPAGLMAFSGFIALRFPLNRKAQETVRRRLYQRDERFRRDQKETVS